MELSLMAIIILFISARWWPWARVEYFGKKKIFKYITILVTAQVFILLSALMTARLYRSITFSSTVKRDISHLVSIKGPYNHLVENEVKELTADQEGSLEREDKGPENDLQERNYLSVNYTVLQDTYPTSANNTKLFEDEGDVKHSKNSDAGNTDSKISIVLGDNNTLLHEIRNSGQNLFINNNLSPYSSVDLERKAESKTGQVYDLHDVKISERVKNKNNISSHKDNVQNTEIKSAVEDNTTIFHKEYISGDLTQGQQSNISLSDRRNNTLRHDNSPVINTKYKFKSYRVKFPPKFILKSETNSYFTKIGDNRTCFERGTDIEQTKQTSGEKCVCREHYYGTDCGIPDAVWFSMKSISDSFSNLRRRIIPRRIINGLPVNHEFAMFEARMHELYEVVDVFMIAESNYTAHGDPKQLQFLDRFRKGYLAKFQDKMVYVKLGFFSEAAKADGWFADSFIRTYMGKEGLRQINGLRDDDIFVLSDADELPSKEVITFLKLYDGYPEPVGFGFRWNIFNFYWLMPPEQSNGFLYWGENERLTIVYSAATIGFLRNVALNDPFLIRRKSVWEEVDMASRLEEYNNTNPVMNWIVGTIGHYAGWHCSWCFSPKDIVRKLDSAQAGDKPRWGDYPEKKNLEYITSLIWKGRWFDDRQHFIPFNDTQARFYAPPYLMQHPDLYRSMLFHPSHPMNLNKGWSPQ